MKDDAIIAEVRRVRAGIFRKCGGTLEHLYAHLKALEDKNRDRVVVRSVPRRRTRRDTRVA